MRSEPLSAGARLGPDYEIVEHLSRGRRLDVYDAWSFSRGCRVVLKSVRAERAAEPAARAALLAEGELLMELTHPHLVRAYETFTEPAPTIVLETLTGETVDHMIEAGGRPSAIEAAHLVLQLGSALRYLHAHGVLHLDLKPGNLVAEGGRVKLFDLSVARPPGPAPPGVGTPDYMAPEQARGDALGPAADAWGVGVVLYELLSGRRAFGLDLDEDDGEGADDDGEGDEDLDQEGGEDVRYLQLEGRAEALDGTALGVGDALVALIAACLEPDPAERPTIAELLARAEPIAAVPAASARWRGA